MIFHTIMYRYDIQEPWPHDLYFTVRWLQTLANVPWLWLLIVVIGRFLNCTDELYEWSQVDILPVVLPLWDQQGLLSFHGLMLQGGTRGQYLGHHIFFSYLLKSVWWGNIIFGILVQCDRNIDLKLCMYVSDLYFMVQRFYLMSWRLFDGQKS